MIVVHGTWVKDSNKEVNGRFFVWGESLAAARQQKELYLPRPAKNKVPLHPFQASDQELITVLLNLSAG
ncbi:MAG: hypothetical protein H5T99_12740, partial [Moorella sp. (in: Bacteria)]|nr:hypothetical protein [Moorella sp. (in: firmicutes)]